MTDKKKRVGILISGRGSNMLSLIAAARAADYPAEIACVLSNRPEAEGLFKAAGAGLQTRAETPRPTIVTAAVGCRHGVGEQRWIVSGSVVGSSPAFLGGRAGSVGGAFRHEGLPVLR